MMFRAQSSSDSVRFVLPDTRESSRWGIILAGGEGKRMGPLVQNWLGENRPKQYCTFVGSRSMLQHTVDRARMLLPNNRLVTIIGQGHERFLDASLSHELPGRVIEQPKDLGTALGILLPTAYILANDPEAVIVTFPSDHFVYPEEIFCLHVDRALELIEIYRERIILLAAIPNRPETDYGWIGPKPVRQGAHPACLSHGLMRVMNFREKPDVNEANSLYLQGSMWNTMVMAFRAKTLWALARKHLPETMYWFDAFLRVLYDVRKGWLEPECEEVALEQMYEGVASVDFSRDILQHAADQTMVLPMDGVDWCDWGRPQRVSETLARLDRRPLFPSNCMEHVFEPVLAGEGLGNISPISQGARM